MINNAKTFPHTSISCMQTKLIQRAKIILILSLTLLFSFKFTRHHVGNWKIDKRKNTYTLWLHIASSLAQISSEKMKLVIFLMIFSVIEGLRVSFMHSWCNIYWSSFIFRLQLKLLASMTEKIQAAWTMASAQWIWDSIVASSASAREQDSMALDVISVV